MPENVDRGWKQHPRPLRPRDTNLHHVWDTSIPEKIVAATPSLMRKKWAASLTTEFQLEATDLLHGSGLRGWIETIPLSTTLAWRRNRTPSVCSTVMPDGIKRCGESGSEW